MSWFEDDARAFIDEQRGRDPDRGWRKVSDELPGDCIDVLVYVPDGSMRVTFAIAGQFYGCCPTHWQPLPEPPEDT